MTRTDVQKALDTEYAKSGRLSEIGSPAYNRELAARYRAEGVGTPQDAIDARAGAGADLDARRKELRQQQRDRYAADPALLPQAGSRRYHAELRQLYKDNGVSTAEDAPGGGRGAVPALAAVAVLQGLGAAAANGSRGGQVLGQIADGLRRGLTTSGQGLVKLGSEMGGLVLSGLGKTGAGAAGLAGGIGSALVAGLSGVGSLAVAGLKLGGSLVGGIVGGVTAGAGGILGAVVGALAGGAGGALLGAGIGVSLAGLLVSTLTTALSAVGGVAGQLLAGLGESLGHLLGSIGDALNGVKSTLGDLIETGKAWASATLTVGRTGNLPLGQASGVAAFANVLTGQPGGLNALFAGFANMNPFRASKLAAFGVQGVTGNPLSDIGAAGRAYTGMNPIQRQMLLGGAFGDNPALGNLFAANATPQGRGLLNYALGAARRTEQSPGDTVRGFKLGIDLSVVSNQLDGLKLKLLSALMPALQASVNLVTRLLGQNTDKILSGFLSVGEFLYVKFPTILQSGLAALLGFGQAFATALPQIFTVATQLLIGFVRFTQGVAANIGKAPLAHQILGDGAANALSSYGAMSLKDLGLTDSYGQGQYDMAARRRAQADHLDDVLNKRQYGLDRGLAAPGNDQALDKSVVQADIDAQRAVAKRLRAEADAAQKAAQGTTPGLGAVTHLSESLRRALTTGQTGLKGVGGYLGTEADRQKSFNEFRDGVNRSQAQVIKVEVDNHHHITFDLDKLKATTVSHVSRQRVMAIQRQGE